MLQLFADRERTDGRPIQHDESLFRFYDRVPGPEFDAVRGDMERMYSGFPDPHGDLRQRLRSGNTQHYGAMLELVVYSLFCGLGYEVAREPRVGRRNIDFKVQHLDRQYLVECRHLYAPKAEAEEAERARISEVVNRRVQGGHFKLDLYFKNAPSRGTKLRGFCRDLQAWLNDLDHCEVSRLLDERGPNTLPRRAFILAGGEVEIAAWPWGGRGSTDVVMSQTAMVPVNQPDDLLRKMAEKRSRAYGELDTPYFLALWDQHHGSDPARWVSLLVGESVPWAEQFYHGGLWFSDIPGPNRTFPQERGAWHHRGMSGVILFGYKSVHHLGDDCPLLIPHPAAQHPVDDFVWPFRRLQIDGDRYVEVSSNKAVRDCVPLDGGRFMGTERP